ncbi:MAG: discoidin domain-containing protein, partial [Betaproteobacteria bacterium]|nr:discoidin domain-containing protein [Betaproteobacteria bacterium]
IDVLNVLYRTMDRPDGSYTSSAGGVVANVYDGDVNTYCQQSSTNGNIAVNFGTTNPQYVGSIGFLPYVSGGGSATWNYTLQYSTDGSTWNTLATGTNVAVTDNQWVWTDIDPGQNVAYYRMQATSGTTLALRELYFGNNSTEITMSRLNRDDYVNLPNKNFTANQPFQYWLNRTIPQATLTVWPTPSSSFVQMTVWYSAYIEDVGALSGQLAIPDRPLRQGNLQGLVKSRGTEVTQDPSVFLIL